MHRLLQKFQTQDRSKRLNAALILGLVAILIGAFFLYNKVFVNQVKAPIIETDLPFDPEGPYAILTPRRDGNALVLNIKRVGDVSEISYDLTYQSQGIDRGVHGDIKKQDSGDKKSEYSQEILFGTCSQGFTSGGAHCVFDKGVENGTLTLHIIKGEKGYRMITPWHLQQPDLALGKISSADSHFLYTTTASRQDLALIGYTIVNDLSGVPKLPVGKKVVGKVYVLNVPVSKTFPSGEVTIELADKPEADSKLAEYNDSKNSWDILETKNASGSSILNAQGLGEGIFAVLTPATTK